MGQNFLIDPGALKKVVTAAAIPPGSTILEIGPGVGSLTRYLALAARRVVAVELDERLLPPLAEVLGPHANVKVVPGDILAADVDALVDGEPYDVVANIPYYITSAVVRHLLTARQRPGSITLTVQAEVAGRICAGPGAHSLLSLSVQIFGNPSIRAHIPGGAFYPPPKVDSAVVHIGLYDQPAVPAGRMDVFFRLLKAGFSQKRKNLRNSLSAGLGMEKAQVEGLLEKAGLDPSRRAQTLNVPEWLALVDAYSLFA
ncbi:MAG: ribosomal RNA small subunit methyltransferase A [Chloroflexi bacterium]|nr:ribosomal RNA small subunit methyltransferase A [Chloroflexota bacterium]